MLVVVQVQVDLGLEVTVGILIHQDQGLGQGQAPIHQEAVLHLALQEEVLIQNTCTGTLEVL